MLIWGFIKEQQYLLSFNNKILKHVLIFLRLLRHHTLQQCQIITKLKKKNLLPQHIQH